MPRVQLRWGWILGKEVLPDPGGALGFAILILILAGYIVMVPDARGNLFGPLLESLPGSLRGSFADAFVDGILQSLLLAGPPVCLYMGLRHLRVRGDSLLPFITLCGGGFLTLLTLVGVVLECWTGLRR